MVTPFGLDIPLCVHVEISEYDLTEVVGSISRGVTLHACKTLTRGGRGVSKVGKKSLSIQAAKDDSEENNFTFSGMPRNTLR